MPIVNGFTMSMEKRKRLLYNAFAFGYLEGIRSSFSQVFVRFRRILSPVCPTIGEHDHAGN